MNLTNFLNKEKKQEKKLIFEDENIEIFKNEDKKTYKIKSTKAFEKGYSSLPINLTKSKILKNTDEVESFLNKSLDEDVEGIMLKVLNSKYISGSRVESLYKVKKNKEDLDVVIVGAEWGSGKRAGFYSSFFVAIKKDENSFLEIGKVASGIKEISGDISMSNLTNLLNPLKIGEDENRINFKPKIIVQVRYQDIQKSVSYDSGFALRFPRIIALREDKLLDEINSLEDIKRLI